ncbi:MAG: hypothetical protein U9N81_03770 [Bacillota bacterium]|nr:hypothetical protein [Bacillota bacterium]
MKTAIVLLVIGIVMVLCTYTHYLRISKGLTAVREEDLVSYYLNLAGEMVPLPLWSGLIGIVLLLIGIIMLLIHLPWTI